MSSQEPRLPRRRSGYTISAHERGIEPPSFPVPGNIAALLNELEALPSTWHEAGTLPIDVLRAVVRHAVSKPLPISASAETGCGKSTLLFSHLSASHKVFTICGPNDSLPKVRASPLLNRSTVEFIEGPSQTTLPSHGFERELELALIDGSHTYPVPDFDYYYIYPHLKTDALLIVDDIHIPSIFNMFEFISADEMFELLQIVGNTAFFRRTESPTREPLRDHWTRQRYNQTILVRDRG
jgi:hypothetical protein